jgi:hypothetical protein
MESSYIKACLSAYFRFSKQCHFIATEVGRFNADFLTVKKGMMTEVEIKVSKADLNNDFKKQKHQIYEQNASPWTPNYFYFCVPPELVDYAVAKCVDKPYGVMVAKPAQSIAKQTRWAKDRKTAERTIEKIKGYLENFELISIDESGRSYGGVEIKYKASAYFPFKERVRIVKRAKKMNNNIPSRKIIHYIVARLASEMSNLRIEFERNKESEDK